MHTVLAGPPSFESLLSGFLTRGIGEIIGSSCVVLFILFLRFVNVGPQDQFTGALLDVKPRKVQVAQPRRPPQHGRDLREILRPHREYRTSSPASPPRTLPNNTPIPPSCTTLHLVGRQNLPRHHPLYRPQRYLQTQTP